VSALCLAGWLPTHLLMMAKIALQSMLATAVVVARCAAASTAVVCSAPSPVCIRGSPGLPGPGKDTLHKFGPGDPQSASIEACCAAASSVEGCAAVQLVQKPEQQPTCWLMSHAHASQTMKFTCTSVIVQAPPTPVPRRAGPPQLPLGGSARGIVNLGGGPAAQAGDPAFERFQQVDLQWTDIEAKEGEYNFSKLESLALSINASGRMAVFKVNSNFKPRWLYDKVPWSNITWTPEQMDGRTAMYWHPAYVAALTRRIAAEARWLATSPHGHLYTYVRQTWAAIGEEGLGIPAGKGAAVKALRDGSSPAWVVVRRPLCSFWRPF
jgi:hypothetical protein